MKHLTYSSSRRLTVKWRRLKFETPDPSAHAAHLPLGSSGSADGGHATLHLEEHSLQQFAEFLPQSPQNARLGDTNGTGLHGEFLRHVDGSLTVDRDAP